MKDKISIITTYYNTGQDIIACLNSVLSQLKSDKFDLEYIIVNDCSTDNTYEYVEKFIDIFKRKDKNINVIHISSDHNLGRGAAKRLGIKISSGNYLMFLDSDDHYLNNDLILRCYNNIINENADICEFGFKYINKVGERSIIKAKNNLIINQSKKANMQAMFDDDYIMFMPWTKLIKKSIVDTYQYSDDREFDDVLTVPYWVYNANKIIIISSVEVIYHPSHVGKNVTATRYKTVQAISSLFEDFKNEKSILKMMYNRCLTDLRVLMSEDTNTEIFKKASLLNTKMLSYIFPDTYKSLTFNLE